MAVEEGDDALEGRRGHETFEAGRCKGRSRDSVGERANDIVTVRRKGEVRQIRKLDGSSSLEWGREEVTILKAMAFNSQFAQLGTLR